MTHSNSSPSPLPTTLAHGGRAHRGAVMSVLMRMVVPANTDQFRSWTCPAPPS